MVEASLFISKLHPGHFQVSQNEGGILATGWGNSICELQMRQTRPPTAFPMNDLIAMCSCLGKINVLPIKKIKQGRKLESQAKANKERGSRPHNSRGRKAKCKQ